MSPPPPTAFCLSLQLNTDIETHVRNMSTRRRIPSKSTEDVGDHHCHFNTNTDAFLCTHDFQPLLCFRLPPLSCATWNKSCII